VPRPLKYHEVIARLRAYDRRIIELEKRGKGSERILRRRAVNCTITCHGAGTHIGRGLLSHIIRQFKLPRGIFD